MADQMSDAEVLMRPFGDNIAKTPVLLAPERETEWANIFNGPPWDIVYRAGDANFAAIPPVDGERSHIVVHYAGMLSLWASARAAAIIADAARRAVSAGQETLSSAPESDYATAVSLARIRQRPEVSLAR